MYNDNVITKQRAPNSHFLQSKWTILVLMRLSLSPKAHIMFVHITTKVEICLVTEKIEAQEIRVVLDSLTDSLPKPSVVSQTYLHRSEVVKSVSYTETGEDPGALSA